jgi:hypothetical protein
MSKSLPVFLIVVAAGAAQASDSLNSGPASPPLCSDSWYRMIAGKVPTGDAQGHGPDVGSEEWKSAIEYTLGVRGQPNVPRRDSESWCRYIDQLVSQRGSPSNRGRYLPAAAAAWGPSYACDKVRPGSIEAMICGDKELSALDRKLSEVYAAASQKATDEAPPG